MGPLADDLITRDAASPVEEDGRAQIEALKNTIGTVKPKARWQTATEQVVNLEEPASVGIIRLDYDYPPAPGDIDHPDSFDYKVYYRVVPGRGPLPLFFFFCFFCRKSFPQIKQLVTQRKMYELF